MKRSSYIILTIVAVILLWLFFANTDPANVKKDAKKEIKTSTTRIKAEQKKRELWRRDSLALAVKTERLAQHNESLQKQIDSLKQQENEIRYIPVYTTNDEYEQFFAKRYCKKVVPR